MSSSTSSNTSTTMQPNEAAPTLLGETCPKCGNEEAWHGVITEPGERERFACDECGMWLALTVKKVEPPKRPRKDRRFELTAAFQNGHLFIEFNDNPLLTWKPGEFLEVGGLAITTTRAIADGEDAEFYRGFDGGREAARREAAEKVTEHLITIRTIAPGRVTGSCSCGTWHPVASADSEVIREAGEAHKAEESAA